LDWCQANRSFTNHLNINKFIVFISIFTYFSTYKLFLLLIETSHLILLHSHGTLCLKNSHPSLYETIFNQRLAYKKIRIGITCLIHYLKKQSLCNIQGNFASQQCYRIAFTPVGTKGSNITHIYIMGHS
jgi:hypothetical protein